MTCRSAANLMGQSAGVYVGSGKQQVQPTNVMLTTNAVRWVGMIPEVLGGQDFFTHPSLPPPKHSFKVTREYTQINYILIFKNANLLPTKMRRGEY